MPSDFSIQIDRDGDRAVISGLGHWLAGEAT